MHDEGAADAKVDEQFRATPWGGTQQFATLAEWQRHGKWLATKLLEPPSRYFAEHVYGCFIDDVFGAAHLRDIGVDNCMMETDYPHSDSSSRDDDAAPRLPGRRRASQGHPRQCRAGVQLRRRRFTT